MEDLLGQEIFMGLALPYIPKRLALELQGVIEPRRSLIEEELNAARGSSKREETLLPSKMKEEIR